MVDSNNAINNTVGASISGVTNTLTVTNPSNTASSGARSSISVGGGSAADPTVNFNVAAVTDWEMGIDNSSSDAFKLSQGTALGTNDTFIMTTAGERTMPLQPLFYGYLPSNDNNVTGDGTDYDVGATTALTEVVDQGGDFTTSGVFTAPVTGNYQLIGGIYLVPAGSSHTQANAYFVATGQSYLLHSDDPWAVRNKGGGDGFVMSIVVPMDAMDTVIFRAEVGGGSKTADIRGNGSLRQTFFAGFLVA